MHTQPLPRATAVASAPATGPNPWTRVAGGRLSAVALLLALGAGCSAETVTLNDDTATLEPGDGQNLPDLSFFDAGLDLATADESGLAELPGPSDTASADAVAGTDAGADSAAEDAEPSPGSPGSPCANHGECGSGLCLELDDGKKCAKFCQTGCPAGDKCVQISLPGADLAEYCVPSFPRLCEPCTVDSDCNNIVGGADSRCVPYTDGSGSLLGQFCSTACKTSSDCPGGYACQDTASVGGVKSKQCVKSDLVCTCDARATKLGLSAPCSNASAIGTCGGKRTCSEAGLSACSAKEAGPEQCNLADDDCDGVVDEPSAGMCDDGLPCTYDNCIAGGCQHPNFAGACSDEDLCTSGDVCDNGKCIGAAVDCDDKNPCTVDTCSPSSGCKSADAGAISCDDGNACTAGDACQGAVCTPGDQTLCDDKNPCTTDTCNPKLGCQFAQNTLPCDDGDLCTFGDACKAGLCTAPKTLPCSDGNPCTSDGCDPKAGCLFAPSSGPCSDGNVCTQSDACEGGQCAPGAALDCDDANPCTLDTCLAKTGCSHLQSSAPCDDGSVCSVGDVCSAGSCVPGTPQGCEDGNPCTGDSCDAKQGCLHAQLSTGCDDGNACTVGEACKAGKCTPTGLAACDDKQPCTVDACDPIAGCSHTPGSAPCDDGSVCTLGDACADGYCKSGKPISCDDGNPCTDNGCDIKDGCLNPANSAPCSDGNACTVGDACAGGKCQVGQYAQCDDGNSCTDDLCSIGFGCTYLDHVGDCSDGSACTAGDACVKGLCAAGTSLSCDDGNTCTDDACDATKGCAFTPNTAPCSDGNGCTGGDACQAGKCAPGKGCDAKALCTPGPKATSCVCAAGYEGDGFGCTDTDECQKGTADCGQNTDCNNTVGSYACTCKSGYVDCNGKASDGCEVQVAGSDAANCGGCGKVCSSSHITAACSGGSCSGTCAAGYDDCNSDKLSDGCETQIAGSDANNCGSCGFKCPGGQTCSAGKCNTYGDWLVGTACNGVDYGGGCTPAETGYHYKGLFNGYQCWWHTKNQAWQTSTTTNIYSLAMHFGLTPSTAVSAWCHAFSANPTMGSSSYSSATQVGAWGWCGGAPFSSGGWVCIK